MKEETKTYHAMLQQKSKMSELKDNIRNQLATSVYRDIQANKDNRVSIKPGKRLFTDNYMVQPSGGF